MTFHEQKKSERQQRFTEIKETICRVCDDHRGLVVVSENHVVVDTRKFKVVEREDD